MCPFELLTSHSNITANSATSSSDGTKFPVLVGWVTEEEFWILTLLSAMFLD